MMSSKKLLGSLGAASLVAAALATAAVAANAEAGSNDGASAAKDGARVSGGVAMVAAVVRGAIAGGADASVMRTPHSGGEPRGLAKHGGTDASSVISAARRVNAPGTVGTVGVRPGWGCGDKNHTHSGPPGRPDADPPPGCDR